MPGRNQAAKNGRRPTRTITAYEDRVLGQEAGLTDV
jgi:hypothetical protein